MFRGFGEGLVQGLLVWGFEVLGFRGFGGLRVQGRLF